MRYITLLFTSVLLALFNASSATYTNIQEYIDDTPKCAEDCYDFLRYWYDHICADGITVDCWCTSGPSTTSSVVADIYVKANDCVRTTCSTAEVIQFNSANNEMSDTCVQHSASNSQPAYVSQAYQSEFNSFYTKTHTGTGYHSGPYGTGGVRTKTGSYPIPTGTGSFAPTGTVNITEATGSVTAVLTGLPSGSFIEAAQQTGVSAGVWSVVYNWKASVGVPVMVSIALSFGMFFL